jgi:hypothetical protein
MSKNQKGFLVLLMMIAWCMVCIAALWNALVDNSLYAQVLPLIPISAGLLTIFVCLGDKK